MELQSSDLLSKQQAKSIIGKFAPNKQDTSGVHGSPLGSEEMEKFKENLQWEGDVFQHDVEVYVKHYTGIHLSVSPEHTKNIKQNLKGMRDIMSHLLKSIIISFV